MEVFNNKLSYSITEPFYNEFNISIHWSPLIVPLTNNDTRRTSNNRAKQRQRAATEAKRLHKSGKTQGESNNKATTGKHETANRHEGAQNEHTSQWTAREDKHHAKAGAKHI